MVRLPYFTKKYFSYCFIFSKVTGSTFYEGVSVRCWCDKESKKGIHNFRCHKCSNWNFFEALSIGSSFCFLLWGKYPQVYNMFSNIYDFLTFTGDAAFLGNNYIIVVCSKWEVIYEKYIECKMTEQNVIIY